MTGHRVDFANFYCRLLILCGMLSISRARLLLHRSLGGNKEIAAVAPARVLSSKPNPDIYEEDKKSRGYTVEKRKSETGRRRQGAGRVHSRASIERVQMTEVDDDDEAGYVTRTLENMKGVKEEPKPISASLISSNFSTSSSTSKSSSSSSSSSSRQKSANRSSKSSTQSSPATEPLSHKSSSRSFPRLTQIFSQSNSSQSSNFGGQSAQKDITKLEQQEEQQERIHDDEKKEERISRRLARLGEFSVRNAQRLVKGGHFAVNGRIIHDEIMVRPEDVITHNRVVLPYVPPAPIRVWLHFRGRLPPQPKRAIRRRSLKERSKLVPTSSFEEELGADSSGRTLESLITGSRDAGPSGQVSLDYLRNAGLPRVVAVGHLDEWTEGLVVLTNSTSFSQKLQQSQSNIPRGYMVKVQGYEPPPEILDDIFNGRYILDHNKGTVCPPFQISIMDERNLMSKKFWMVISSIKASDKEIVETLRSLGMKLLRFVRTHFGMFSLAEMKRSGAVVELTSERVRDLRVVTSAVEEEERMLSSSNPLKPRDEVALSFRERKNLLQSMQSSWKLVDLVAAFQERMRKATRYRRLKQIRMKQQEKRRQQIKRLKRERKRMKKDKKKKNF